MQTVVWIAWVGALLLFAALAGLVALMYLLTSPLLFVKRTRTASRAPADDSAAQVLETQEPERRRRAAALAVAVACAEADRWPVFSTDEPSNWRLMHRALRLRQRVSVRGGGE